MADIVQNPQKSESSLFFERYASAEQAVVTLKYAVVFLAGVGVVLCGALVFTVTRPKPVFFVPSALSAELVYPGKVPLSSVKSFAAFWLMNWMNYTPEAVKGVYERAVPFMTPQLLSKLRSRMDEEFKKITRDRLSSSFVLTSEPIAEITTGGFNVSFAGDRIVFMGKEEMKTEIVRFTLAVTRSSPTERNPYGLVVADIRKEKEITNEK
ncbi:MAG: hypothetical protein HQL16_04800 [Candidatus Omnitrophica bacterium]|nr:hypothetical protein [Candidatus Omnitrophota bacterium]